nr:PREDICTED: probable cleavage and polyadenylation specificity factor subunit 2 isoform X2 [Bemisia tabaci]
MTSIIRLQALSGAMDESPHCYILQVDNFVFLLDCGWNENFDMTFMNELKRHVSHIDAVLITYPDPLHLGALPYLVGKCNLNCPVYATIPVYKMGQMFMYDLYQSRYNQEDFTVFDLDDVDAAFDKMIQLKYNQSVQMKGKGIGITITPLLAGHMIGGTIWKIMKVGEEDIIYSVDFNHKKERHLNGCDFEKLGRPSLLITDAYNATYQQERRRIRDEKLMTNILQTLREKGNVLVAVDTAGRVLELAHMLDQLWRNAESGLVGFSLVLLNNVCYNVIEFAKSQIEWMSEKLMRSFEGLRSNPCQFKHLRLCHSLMELNKVPSPKVVLASTPDMESGFSRELFLQWCANPSNSIILTSRTSPGTLARKLIDLHQTGKRSFSLQIKKRVRLEGAELDAYLRKQAKHQTKPQLDLYKMNDTKTNVDDEANQEEEETLEDIHEVPSKCIQYSRTVNVLCQIEYIDFEGRSDGESLTKIIGQLRPRRLILVRGLPENISHVANHAKTYLKETAVYIPTKGEMLDVTTESHIYQIRLTDALVSSLEFQKGKDAELSWIDARVTERENLNEKSMQVDEESTGIELNKMYTLDILPPNEEVGHVSSFVNEIKLSDFKQVLTKHNISAEFSGGTLWCCNGTVAVRRPEGGKVSLEGILCDDFFKIRHLLYSQYAII